MRESQSSRVSKVTLDPQPPRSRCFSMNACSVRRYQGLKSSLYEAEREKKIKKKLGRGTSLKGAANLHGFEHGDL